MKANFTLGSSGDGIAPLADDVTLELTGGTGSFSTTIPASSFKFVPAKPANKKGKGGKPEQLKFEGVIGGVSLEAKITPVGATTFAGATSFEFKAEGEGADLGGLANPVTVTLTIGNDSGSATVTAEIE